MKIAALTCTGGRPQAFKLCEEYMSRQTRQPDAWVVVDDCNPATACTLGQEVVRPTPRWRPGGPVTLARNLVEGIAQVESWADGIVILEDDDHYDPAWIETAERWLEQNALVGETRTLYYNVATRRYHEHENLAHASLCATAFSAELFDPIIDTLGGYDGPWVDNLIWAKFAAHGHLYHSRLVVGIKGLPGRPGAGQGHTLSHNWFGIDLDGRYLEQLTGEADARRYLDMFPRKLTEADKARLELARKYLPPPGSSHGVSETQLRQRREFIEEQLRNRGLT